MEFLSCNLRSELHTIVFAAAQFQGDNFVRYMMLTRKASHRYRTEAHIRVVSIHIWSEVGQLQQSSNALSMAWT